MVVFKLRVICVKTFDGQLDKGKNVSISFINQGNEIMNFFMTPP